MAVSYHTYWDTCQYLDYPTTPSFSLPDLMDMELQQSLSFDQNTPCFDSIFETTLEDYSHLLLDTSPSLPEFESYPHQYSYPCLYPYQSLPTSKSFMFDNFVDLSTPVEDQCQTPPMSKWSVSDCFTDFSTSVERQPEFQFQMLPKSKHSWSDSYVDFSTHMEKLPEFEFQAPPVFNIGISDSGGGSGTLSAQSVAARQRRRKITEKTQELGKMVPGGNKMNTAEMFGAAYKYIKFLQAQVGILQLLDSTDQENEVAQLPQCDQLKNLATSTKIQEKLYWQEKCLVPNKLIKKLSNDHELQTSNPIIAKEINQLIQKSG